MNSISIYPPGCKDIQTELANDELIRRLKVKTNFSASSFKRLILNKNSE